MTDYYCLGDDYLCATLRYQTDPGLALSVFKNHSMVWMEVVVHLMFLISLHHSAACTGQSGFSWHPAAVLFNGEHVLLYSWLFSPTAACVRCHLLF